MQKVRAKLVEDELRPEYDLRQLRGKERGKYYRQAQSDTNLVLIEPDLTATFPTQDSVNRALRLLVSTAKRATSRRRRGAASRQRTDRVASKRNSLPRP